MSRILLVDDSPHAQRMGQQILSGEGYEVVTVSDVDSALIRLEDVDPDVVLADTVMPGRSGFELCNYIKMSPRLRHVRVVLTSGILEPLDAAEAARVEADGMLKKPFEASALLSSVKSLAGTAAELRRSQKSASPRPGQSSQAQGPQVPSVPFLAVVDEEQVRAAVAIALDASMETMVTEIAQRVVTALTAAKTDPAPPLVKSATAGTSVPPPPVPPDPPLPAARRVTPVRMRSSSILGLDSAPEEAETGTTPDPDPRPPAAGPRI
jgi:CheY-like chemotaxis protein